MRFLNAWEVAERAEQYDGHPILGPATRTLANLMEWTDRHSDGWAYWPKPARAAERLMELVERDGTSRYRFDDERADVTVAEFRAALRPLRAFRTRQGAEFVIEDVGDRERWAAEARAAAERERGEADYWAAQGVVTEGGR